MPSLIGLDVHEATVSTDDGASLYAIVAGAETGPTVVLAHCWAGNHTFWNSVTRSLVADGYRVISYDHREHGLSTGGRNPLTTDQLGDDLLTVLTTLGAQDAVVVGHSMGGMAIQGMLSKHPPVLERLHGVILVATSARPLGIEISRRLAHQAVGDRRTKFLARLSPDWVRPAFGPAAGPVLFRQLHDAVVATSGAGRADGLVALSVTDFRGRLGHVTLPTRIVVGSHDRLTPPFHSRKLTDLIPGAEMMFLERVGHMVPLESPQAVVDAVRSIPAPATASTT